METHFIKKLKYFWANADYGVFCNKIYGGKNDSYTVEKWNKFQNRTMWYIAELGDQYMERFIQTVEEFYLADES